MEIQTSDGLRPEILNHISWSKLKNQFEPPQLAVKLITSQGIWFKQAYALMEQEFGDEELDEESTFIRSLELMAEGDHPFPLITVAGYYTLGETAFLAGVISGNLMRLGNSNQFFFAIAYQVTSAVLRGQVRGIGKRILQESLEVAADWAKQRGGELPYSACESHDDSRYYFLKMGYKFIQGVPYWQPPLMFDEHGDPERDECPETLMVRCQQGEKAETINRTDVKEIIKAMYLNWCIENHRLLLKRLSPEALEHVKFIILSHYFRCVCDRMAPGDPLYLEGRIM